MGYEVEHWKERTQRLVDRGRVLTDVDIQREMQREIDELRAWIAERYKIK